MIRHGTSPTFRATYATPSRSGRYQRGVAVTTLTLALALADSASRAERGETAHAQHHQPHHIGDQAIRGMCYSAAGLLYRRG